MNRVPSVQRGLGLGRRGLRSLGLLLFLGLFAGCAGISTYQSPRTVKRGAVEVDIRPQVTGAVVDAQPLALPTLDMAMRYGLGDHTDFGFRLGMSGIGFDVKYNFLRKAHLSMALAPGIGGIFAWVPGVGGATLMNTSIPLIIGFQPTSKTEFVIAPKFTYRRAKVGGTEESAEAQSLITGVSIGMTQEFSPTFRVRPELTVATARYMGSNTLSDDTFDQYLEGLMFNVGIALSFGGGYSPKVYADGDGSMF